MQTEKTKGLQAAAEERAALKRRAVEETIVRMRQLGEYVTFKSVAEQAGCSRQYLYNHFADVLVTLREGSHTKAVIAIESKQIPQRSEGRATAIEKVLREKISQQQAEIGDLRKANTGLTRRFEKALGEAEDWRTRHNALLAELNETQSRLARYER